MYDARLCSAELLVIRGDLRILRDPQTPAHHRRGLRTRIAAALGTLNWLCRRYSEAHRQQSAELSLSVSTLRDTLRDEDISTFLQQVDTLISRFPLSLEGLQPQAASTAAIASGEQLYRGYCAACHDNPDLRSDAPAFSLFALIRQQSLEEFIARMLVGVHGTGEISLRNPLSDRDIAGMTAYFLATSPKSK